MNEALVAGNFVRSAYRLPAPLAGTISGTAKAEYDSARAVMETDKVYAHFEMDEDDSLLCVFSTQHGILLGETIRNWIKQTRGELADFLWCEKLGSEYAMVCILDGRVVKESFEDQFSAEPQLNLLIKRVQDHNPDFSIFIHEEERDELHLGSDLPIVLLEDSILQHIKEAKSASLPRLHKYGKALAEISRARIIARIIIAGILAGIIVVPGTWYGANWWYGEMPEVRIDDFKEIRAQNRVYNELLHRSDIQDLLPAIHQASQTVISSLGATDTWYVSELLWNYGGNLQVVVHIPELTDVFGDTMQIPPDMKTRLQNKAKARGWTVQILETSAKIEVPVAVEPRSVFEADRLRLYEPTKPNERWYPTKLAQDMEAMGTMEVDENVAGRTSQYYFRPATLHLSSDPWLNGQTATWLGRKLADGPLLVDSLTLRATEGSRGGLMDGTIKFRLLWRAR